MSSSAAGSSGSGAQTLVGNALYSWCRNERDYGYVFVQEELLASNIIPNRDPKILLSATQYLVSKHLLKIHDIKGQEGIGWELVSHDTAKSYDGLTSDEQMVFASIEGAASQGIWTKTIKAKSGVHAKVLDRVYKSLESKQLIKQMKSVKNPGRKMYILYGLQPSEEATGGTWFTEGQLDTEMIDAISSFIEIFCSQKSWRDVSDDDDSDTGVTVALKRKQPDSGFEEKGKGKARKTDYESREAKPRSRDQRTLQPYEPGYGHYPTVRDISKALADKKLIDSGEVIPDNALRTLLDVMVYDDRLYKLYRNPRMGETADDEEKQKVIMYRCFKTTMDLALAKKRRDKAAQESRSAMRLQELEDIGQGGATEIPCQGCPNRDICGENSQVNPETCVYFDQWFRKMEEADREIDDIW